MQATTVLPSRAIERGSERGLRVRVSALLDRGIFYGLIGIIALSAIPYGAVDPWWVALFQCCVFALTALWIIRGTLEGSQQRIDWPTITPLLAIMVFAFVQTLPLWSSNPNSLSGTSQRIALSADPYQTRLWILQISALTLTGAMLVRFTSDLYRMRVLVFAIIIIAVVSAIFGITRHVMQIPLPVWGFQITPADGGFGQFFNRNHFALLMEMALGLTSGIVFVGVKRIHLPIYLAIIVLLWGALVLSTSRGGIVSMIGQFLLLLSLWNLARPVPETAGAPKGSNESNIRHLSDGKFNRFLRLGRTLAMRIVLAICLLATLVAGVIWLGGDALMHRIEVSHRELEPENASRLNARRLSIWKATISMIRDKPLAGVGFGAYRTAIPKYHDGSGRWTPQEAHNEYLETIASGGVIAAVIFAWLVVILAKKVRIRIKQSSDKFSRATGIGALIGLSGVAIHSLVDFGLHVTVNAVICIALIVIATRCIDTRSTQTQTSCA